MLSELEGAILIEIELRKRQTAFQIRKAFQDSPTADWSGSAGAVHPAVSRLVQQGLILSAKTSDKRGTRKLSLTPQGRRALSKWATDPILASRLSSDPFRTRIDYLSALPKADRDKALAQIRKTIEQSLERLDMLLVEGHPLKACADSLAREVVRSRLDWIRETTGTRTPRPRPGATMKG